LIKNIFIFVLIAIAGFLIFFQLTQISEDNPVELMELQGESEELSTWKVVWQEPENKIKKVAVVQDEPDLLKVRFDYHFSGNPQGAVFACGAIGTRKEHVNWSCQPTPIHPGDGTATVTFRMTNKADNFLCSDEVVIKIYQPGDMPFYNNYFSYPKKWLRGEGASTGEIKRWFLSCDSITDTPSKNSKYNDTSTRQSVVSTIDFEEKIPKPEWFDPIESPSLNSLAEVNALWQSKKRCCIDEAELLGNNREFYKACYNAIVDNRDDEHLVVQCLWLMEHGAEFSQRKAIKQYLVDNYFHHKNSVSNCANCATADTVARVSRSLALMEMRSGDIDMAIQIMERVLEERSDEISHWVQTEMYESLGQMYLRVSATQQQKDRIANAYAMLDNVRATSDGVESRFTRFEKVYNRLLATESVLPSKPTPIASTQNPPPDSVKKQASEPIKVIFDEATISMSSKTDSYSNYMDVTMYLVGDELTKMKWYYNPVFERAETDSTNVMKSDENPGPAKKIWRIVNAEQGKQRYRIWQRFEIPERSDQYLYLEGYVEIYMGGDNVVVEIDNYLRHSGDKITSPEFGERGIEFAFLTKDDIQELKEASSKGVATHSIQDQLGEALSHVFKNMFGLNNMDLSFIVKDDNDDILNIALLTEQGEFMETSSRSISTDTKGITQFGVEYKKMLPHSGKLVVYLNDNERLMKVPFNFKVKLP